MVVFHSSLPAWARGAPPVRGPEPTPPGLARSLPLLTRMGPWRWAPLQRPLPGALRRALPRAPPDAAAGPAIRHWIKNSSVPPAPASRPPAPAPAPRPALPARSGSARLRSPAQPAAAAAAGRPSAPARLSSARVRAAAMQRRGALFGMPGGSGSRKMAAGDIGELLVPHLPTIRVPRSGDRVYKNECAFSYDSPVSEARGRSRRGGGGSRCRRPVAAGAAELRCTWGGGRGCAGAARDPLRSARSCLGGAAVSQTLRACLLGARRCLPQGCCGRRLGRC